MPSRSANIGEAESAGAKVVAIGEAGDTSPQAQSSLASTPVSAASHAAGPVDSERDAEPSQQEARAALSRESLATPAQQLAPLFTSLNESAPQARKGDSQQHRSSAALTGDTSIASTAMIAVP